MTTDHKVGGSTPSGRALRLELTVATSIFQNIKFWFVIYQPFAVSSAKQMF